MSLSRVGNFVMPIWSVIFIFPSFLPRPFRWAGRGRNVLGLSCLDSAWPGRRVGEGRLGRVGQKPAARALGRVG